MKNKKLTRLLAILPLGDPTKFKIDPNNPAQDSIRQLLNNAIQLALTVAGGIAVIYLIIGAFGYFTAFGNEEKATKAKMTITWAIVGVVLILLSKVILNEVLNLVSSTPPTLP